MSIKIIEGQLDAKGMKFAIISSRFNDFISDKLVSGAIDSLIRHNALSEDITLVKVPGAYEIPLTALKFAESGSYDAIITLGAVIRGSTPHFDYVANEVSKGVATASLKTGIPIVFGVLTTDTIEQSIERAGTKSGNKGFDAAMTAIEMVSLFKKC